MIRFGAARVTLRRMKFPASTLAIALVAVACAPAARASETPPPGVEQLLPRGAIPAILEPAFVAADEAEIPAGAWILGVVVDGEARAYDLNRLNQHEVVNDRVGGRDIAAVW